MISSSSNGSNGKSILASLGLVGLAIVMHWCYLDFELSSLKKKKEKKRLMNDDIDDGIQDWTASECTNVHGLDDESKSGGGDIKEFLFPWEPNYVPKGIKKDKSEVPTNSYPEKHNPAESSCTAAFGSSRGRHERQAAEHSITEELDFLASMTFANGGLRSPSCPCCV